MTTEPDDASAADVAQLRASLDLASRLEQKHTEALGLVRDLRRTLVFRLIRLQHPHVTVDEQKALLKFHGVES